jgi:dTMP kinase
VSSNRFITFEGIEGSGKSTQVDRAAEYLEGRGVEVMVTREPGGTRIGNTLRSVLLDPAHVDMAPLTELLIVFAARAQHIEEVIQPALQEGKVVLCDRYEDSTLAYQGFGRGIPLETIRLLSSLTTTGVKPALTFLLDLPVEEGLGRAHSRNENGEASGEERLDREEVDFHRRVREGYRQLAEDHPGRFRVLNALLPKDKVAHRVRRDLSLFLKLS